MPGVKAIQQAYEEMPKTPGHITPRTFRDRGTTETNAIDKRSKIGTFVVPVVNTIRGGRSNPFRVAVPAYESFTTDGTDGNQEQFNLSNSVVQSPTTDDVVVYLDGVRYGSPDAVDYQNDTIDVTDSGSGSTVHVWYISDEPASIEVEKRTPSAKTSSATELYSAPLNLVHVTRQAEQPEYFEFGSELEGILAADMKLNIYVNAPYEVKFSAEGGAATPDNMLLNIPVAKGNGVVDGLRGVVTAAMG